MPLARQFHGVDDSDLKQRSHAERATALNDNDPAGGTCPVCGAWAPIAPIASDYLDGGLVCHHWVCEPCGHVWTTEVRIHS